jgi:hypothetical protein
MRSMLLVYFLVACGDSASVEESAPSPLIIQGLVERGWLKEWPAGANGISCRVVASSAGTLRFKLADRDPPPSSGKPGATNVLSRSGRPTPSASSSSLAGARTTLLETSIPVEAGEAVTMRWAWWRMPGKEQAGRTRIVLERKTKSAEVVADIPDKCLPPAAGWATSITSNYAGAPVGRARGRAGGRCATSGAPPGAITFTGDSTGFTQTVRLNGIDFPTARAPWPLWALSVRFEPAQ